MGAFVGDCSPGYWCVYGNDRATPNGPNSTYSANDTCFDGQQLGYGGICPLGNYCPGGSASTFPIPCDNGTYADETGLSACKTCPEGYWCPLETSNYTDYPCPTGFYCPNGTRYWNDMPCPVGECKNIVQNTFCIFLPRLLADPVVNVGFVYALSAPNWRN